MKNYYIYLNKSVNKSNNKLEAYREYYQKKLNKSSLGDNRKYVGSAELSDDYFIVGSETHFTNIIDLSDIELEYSAVLKNNKVSTFKITIEDLLYKAKEGILPYISFNGFKVTKKPILRVKGIKHTVDNLVGFKQQIK